VTQIQNNFVKGGLLQSEQQTVLNVYYYDAVLSKEEATISHRLSETPIQVDLLASTETSCAQPA
jgi:hypothetical protein